MPGESKLKSNILISGHESLLAKLESLPSIYRAKPITDGLDAAGRIIVKRMRELVQQPGSPGYTPIPKTARTSKGRKRKDSKRIRDTIGHDVLLFQYEISNKAGALLAVRPQWPAGAHRHLLEHGHRLVHGGSMKKKTMAYEKPESRFGRKRRKGYRGGTTPKALNSSRTGKGTFTSWVNAKPFIEPTYNDTQSQARSTIVSGMVDAINQWKQQNTTNG